MVRLKAAVTVDGVEQSIEMDVNSDRKSIKLISDLLFEILLQEDVEDEETEEKHPELPECMYQ